MTVLLLRALTRVVGFVVLGMGAVAGVVVAVAAAAGRGTVADVSRSVGTSTAAARVDAFLGRLASGDGAAVDRTLAGVAAGGAILLGLALLVGALAPRRRERVLSLDDPALAARPRALARSASVLGDRVRGTSSVGAKVRRRRSRLTLHAHIVDTAAPAAVEHDLRERIAPLASAFGLRVRVRIHRPRRGRSVA
jgi:uncharacterized membrane protein YedE/YeeE